MIGCISIKDVWMKVDKKYRIDYMKYSGTYSYCEINISGQINRWDPAGIVTDIAEDIIGYIKTMNKW